MRLDVNRIRPGLVAGVLALLFVQVAPSRGQDVPGAPPGGADPAREAWKVFAEKCSECHGPVSAGGAGPAAAEAKAAKKTKFHSVLDLPGLAANPRLVVRFDPDRSKLWRTVRDGDMPPEDSRAGPLSAGEKHAILNWIQAGAPAPSAALPNAGAPPIPADSGAGAAELLPVRALHWVGRFHVLVIHFPIALLAAAALAESWEVFRRRRSPGAVVRYCVALGAAGAVAAALLGWSRVSFGGYDPASARTLNLHRWLGTAAAVLAVAVAAASEGDARLRLRSVHFRVMLFGSALLVGAAAHLGGALVHGDDYFSWKEVRAGGGGRNNGGSEGMDFRTG